MDSDIQGHIVFAHLEEPPFCFTCSDGTSSGCDVDLASTILAILGVRRVSFKVTQFNDLIPGFVEQRYDMTTVFVIASEREEIVAFSRSV